MGYFSNGSEGCAYETKYCENCVHWVAVIEGEHRGCPVWDIQMIFNYSPSEKIKTVLNALIPLTKIHNEQCTMFIQIKSEGQTEF